MCRGQSFCAALRLYKAIAIEPHVLCPSAGIPTPALDIDPVLVASQTHSLL